ncbi:MAG TPA: hypothetical protein VF002_07605 [Gaiellaceae bacterium]
MNDEMLATWLHDLESLESISQDDLARALFLKMAWLTQQDRLQPFLFELQHDDDLDDSTKGMLTELAENPSFLLVVEDYVQKTQIVH